MHTNRRFWLPIFALALLLGACAEESPSGDEDAGIGGRDGGRGSSDVGIDVPGDAVSDVPGDSGVTDGPACADFTECAAGSFCNDNGVCETSQCDGFYSPAACGGGKCVPAGYNAYACTANGSGTAGTACTEDSECGAGLLCIGDACSAPDCNPASGDVDCPANATCQVAEVDGFTFDFGFCAQGCESFENDMCPAGEWCYPDSRSPTSGALAGQCVDSAGGTIADGQPCGMEGTACTDGALCIGSEGDAVCRRLCDPNSSTTGLGACTGGLSCSGLVDGDGSALDFGACFESCTPYVPNGSSGCDPTEWCFPSQTQPGVGQCSPLGAGTAMESDLCGEDYDSNGTVDSYETCAGGLLCLGFSETESRCVVPCDPDASAGAAGHCGSVGSYASCSCGELTIDETPLEFGFVQEGCNYVHGGARQECSAWGTCVPGELFGNTTGDVCTLGIPNPGLNEFGNCATAGLEEFDSCSPNGVCLTIEELGGPDLLCYETCMASEGSFNAQAHPDCSRTRAICTEAFESTDFGLCGQDAP